ncbi:MAG: hypothetical protein M3Q07_03075, partial [Pseudobdellovibrionaceae bacterium]|nr:hypothetical protein [Pseudobdellovibrionaceae bacterium]
MLLLMYRMGFFLLLFWAYVPLQAQVSAVQGEMDLKDWKGQPLRLKGDWRFYPLELLSPDSYLQRLDSGDAAATWIPVGQSFQESGRGSMTNIRFGTYVLHLKNIPDIKSLSFSDISAYSASRAFLFIRQQGRTEPALTAGQVSQSQDAALPAISTIEVANISDAMRPEAFLLIQVSN